MKSIFSSHIIFWNACRNLFMISSYWKFIQELIADWKPTSTMFLGQYSIPNVSHPLIHIFISHKLHTDVFCFKGDLLSTAKFARMCGFEFTNAPHFEWRPASILTDAYWQSEFQHTMSSNFISALTFMVFLTLVNGDDNLLERCQQIFDNIPTRCGHWTKLLHIFPPFFYCLKSRDRS